MDRRQCALQSEGLTQLGQRHIRLALEMLTDGNAVLGHDELFAPGEVMPGLDAAGLAPLLEQLLDHAIRDAKALGDMFLGAFTPIAGADDALTEIKGKCGHP